ncbi:MAG: hypothetical protein JXM70_24110, partial [Pirellulales bacterium]|nr:hypothetical protein [Pirellulales bacterium]
MHSRIVSHSNKKISLLSHHLLLWGVTAAVTLSFSLANSTVFAADKPTAGTELLVGAASTSITPQKPVALSGQMRLRVSKKVESPVTANVVVLESRRGDRTFDVAVMVSCDLVVIEPRLIE